jgi:predicted transcriptional regulator
VVDGLISCAEDTDSRLDHLAEELAQEYVRLMEKAARDERIDGDASR